MIFMANKGNKRHINRLASSKYLKIYRKTSAYVTKPAPGRHSLEANISISTVLREKLGVANTLREVKRLLQSGSIKINGKVIKEPKYPIGFGDLLELVPSKEQYRVSVSKGGTFALEKGGSKQIFKVVGKYIASKGKVMIRLDNGTVVHSDKEVHVNDSIELKNGKPGSIIKMENGKRCFVVKGTHASESGVIKNINSGSAQRDPLVRIEGSTGEFETLLDNIMVVAD